MKRRGFVKLIGIGWFIPRQLWAKKKGSPYITKPIPSSGQKIPIIGMGSSRTFNVGSSTKLRNARAEVLRKFFALGGQVIDSSPMYGSSEEVIGYGMKKIGPKSHLIAATKVWTEDTNEGKKQFQDSLKLWGEKDIEIYQIHNLMNWKEHLKVLQKYKSEGKIKYIGITTSHRRRISDLHSIMKTEKLDFIQCTYNLEERWNEKETFSIAKDKGIAVIINRPFKRGDLFDRVEGKKLPKWAGEIDCHNWAQYFLKWVVSHPSVTCAIPATSKVAHMSENMGAMVGKLPDEKMRVLMQKHFLSL